MELNYFTLVLTGGASFNLETNKSEETILEMIVEDDFISLLRNEAPNATPIHFRTTCIQSVQLVPILGLGPQPKLFSIPGEVRATKG